MRIILTKHEIMDFESFRNRIAKVNSADSVTGIAGYFDIAIRGDSVYFKRLSGGNGSISLSELFNAYLHESFLNTSVLDKYISTYAESPSFAILIASGLYDKSGNRLITPEIDELNYQESGAIDLQHSDEDISTSNTKAEGVFFAALGNMLDNKYVLAKSLGKPVRSDQLVLNSHFEEMKFPEEVNAKIRKVLDELESDYMMPRNNMVQHIDGMIVNHPTLGTRIVEFDEEQHFTPARLVTLNALAGMDYEGLAQVYSAIINNNNYFLNSVLGKHRLNFSAGDKVPAWEDFKDMVLANGKSNNGYISPKNGFPYLGGRIAQRAYYDLLRDLAHLSEFNKGRLNPAIRVPKFLIEALCKDEFGNLTMKQIQNAVIEAFKILKVHYQ